MPTLYVLIGVPGSGKSTWISQQPWAKDCAVVSTDNYVEMVAAKRGLTYSEVFDEAMPDAIRHMTQQVFEARDQGRDIIWDQTSTTVASRARKFRLLPDYRAVAVVFATPNPEELARRLASRPGKHIPQRVMNQMIRGWQEPTLTEGFAEIRRA
jgi:predicted kinase